MKKFFYIILLLAFSLFCFSASVNEFNRIVDFNTTLKDLYNAFVNKSLGQYYNKIFILSGTVSAIQIINDDENNFQAILEVFSGEWSGVEEVFLFKCIVKVEGKEFSQRLSRSKDGTNKILPNKDILIVSELSSSKNTYTSENIPVLKAFYIRNIN